jgi:Zn-dependent protease with chaperone function
MPDNRSSQPTFETEVPVRGVTEALNRCAPKDSAVYTHDRYAFALALAFGIGGVLLATAAVVAEIASVHYGRTGSHSILVGGLHFTYPAVNGAAALLTFLAAAGTAATILGLRASLRQRRGYRSFVARIGVVGPMEKDPRVNVIADPLPQAFCAGYLRPQVYVSRRAVELLTETELHAVLAHEHHHRRVRDPLCLAYTRILGEALFFVPVLRSLSTRYAELAELSADRAAVLANAGEAAPLASALLAFDESGPRGAAGISAERVDTLLGEPIQWRLPLWRFAASVVVLVGVSALVWLVSGTARADATFSLPFFSSRPCLILTVLSFAACAWILVRSGRREGRRWLGYDPAS